MNTSQRRKAFGVEGLRPVEAPAVLNIRLGALFVLGARRKFNRKTLVALMIERCGFSERSAQQLAHHWLASEPYRKENLLAAKANQTPNSVLAPS